MAGVDQSPEKILHKLEVNEQTYLYGRSLSEKKWVNFMQDCEFQPEQGIVSHCYTIKLETSRQIYGAIKPQFYFY